MLSGLVCSSAPSHLTGLWGLLVLPPPSSSVRPPSLMALGPRGLECGLNTCYRETTLILSQEQSNPLRMISLSSLQGLEISLPALIWALRLLSWQGISRVLAGSTSAFPGSWFHSEFNEGAEQSSWRRASPSGIPLEGLATCPRSVSKC